MQTFYFGLTVRKDVRTKPKHQFEKHISKSSLMPTEKDYILDFEGRRYVKTREGNIYNEYIAEASVISPRYLIVPKEK